MKKKDNLNWILQMCLDLLKSKDNMSKVIVTVRDTALIIVVATIFPISNVFMWVSYLEKCEC
jgi:hypothetical protein